MYTDTVQKSLDDIDIEIVAICAVDKAVRQVNEALEESVKMAAPRNNIEKKRKSKLKVWTPEILSVVDAKKLPSTNGRVLTGLMMRMTERST